MNPLDQLADISSPDQVSIWPLAWGYWVLLAVLIGLLIWLLVSLRAYYLRRQAMRDALKQLRALDTNNAQFCLQVQVILKNVYSHYFVKQSNLQMHGQHWRKLVTQAYQGNHPEDLAHSLAQIELSLYAPETKNDTQLMPANVREQHDKIAVSITDWIKTSLPPKSPNAISVSAVKATAREHSHV